MKILNSKNEDSSREGMGKLWIKVAMCNYKENDRWLKEQFIKGKNDIVMISELIKWLKTIKSVNKILSDQVLLGEKRVGV